jgi:hypothetical protein
MAFNRRRGQIFRAALAGVGLIAFMLSGNAVADKPVDNSAATDSSAGHSAMTVPNERSGNMTLEKEIRKMAQRRGNAYRPRTRHLDNQGRAIYTNRLFLESSPYLLQHAHNPVD